jgi:hypothetical protein
VTDDERFDAVEADPELDEAMQHEPRVPSLAYVVAARSMFAVSLVFAIAGLAFLLGIPAPVPFKVLWVVMTAVSVALGIAMLVRARRYHAAPIARSTAIVIGTRTQVSGSGRDGSASTSYFVTLQERTGVRTEVHALDNVVGLLTAGDIGVAYIKSRTLVAFRRFNA